MKIITIGDLLGDLTVDSTKYTADSIQITADQTKITNEEKIITIIPRVLPILGDQLVVKVRNELTNIEVNALFDYFITENYLKFYLRDSFYQVNEKYEVNIFMNNERIYIGKLLVVAVGQDIQNYTTTKTINNKLTF